MKIDWVFLGLTFVIAFTVESLDVILARDLAWFVWGSVVCMIGCTMIGVAFQLPEVTYEKRVGVT